MTGIREGSWEHLAEKSKQFPDIIEIRECIEIPHSILILCKKGSLETVKEFKKYVPLGVNCIFKEVNYMTEPEINIEEQITEERLEKIGYTKETFKGSNTEALLKAMLLATEKTIQDETQRLMKEHSLSYGEARIIAIDRVLESIKNGMEKEKLELKE